MVDASVAQTKGTAKPAARKSKCHDNRDKVCTLLTGMGSSFMA